MESTSNSQGHFSSAFTMFWIRWIERGGHWCPIGVPDNPADDESVEVVGYRTHRHRLVPIHT
jgi:hypothetical protein